LSQSDSRSFAASQLWAISLPVCIYIMHSLVDIHDIYAVDRN